MRRRAFTVLELVVVIGIVMMLIGLSLPPLARAREASRALRSAANLRGIGQAMSLYAGRHDGAMPVGEAGVLYPVSVDRGVSMSWTNHFAFGSVWPVLMRDVAPWEEFHRTWISPGGPVPGPSTAAIGAFSYRYSHSFLARPRLWRPGAGGEAGLLRGARDDEVAFPSKKVQAWDAVMPYLLRPVREPGGMLSNPAPMLFADGHADLRRPQDATVPVANVLNPDVVEGAQPLHNTPLGVLGYDY